jgi:radical SAM superfamily enzyme YgiQ (UPF0313 family)
MRVLFIYSDWAITNQRRFQHGIAYLSSALKSDGVYTGLIHIYSKPKKEVFLNNISKFKPDILAYSSLTNQYPNVRVLAGLSKELGIFTIYGGLHPTVAPQICIDTPGIDAICIGEGDEAIRDFVRTFFNGGDITKVKNFWVRNYLNVSRTPTRPLIENLDSLPFPDYDLFPYEDTDDYKVSHSITIQASRGCMYSCTYCCNYYLRSLYPNKEKYLRFRSVDNIIAELKFLLSKYPKARLVRFTDDALSSDKAWFEEFVSRYKPQIGLPYSVNDHPHNITARIARLYKKSGCRALSIGIENGNFYIRKEIMKRPFSDEDIINAFALIRQTHISIASFNIIGIPYESMATLLDTIKLNAKCRPNRYTNAYFQPFQQTQAAKICCEAGWKIKDIPGSFFEEPVVELPDISREQLIFGFKYFGLLVSWYKLLYRFSGNKDWLAVRISDRLFSSELMPYRILDTIMINRMDIKKRFPLLGYYLTQIKRLIFKQNY